MPPVGVAALLTAFALAAALELGSSGVHAQGAAATRTFPTKPIRIIVPFAPGGSNDIFGCYIGQKLTDRLSQQVVIENRSGANGIIGTDLAANALPDGYTLVIVTISFTMSPAINKIPYDPLISFTPISPIASGPNLLATWPGLRVNSVKELLALAKSRPGQLHYSTAGTGGVHHFGGELLKLMAGVDIVPVAYKGGSPMMIAVMAGEVEILFNTLISTLPHLPSGKLKALGVSSAKRTSILPEVPTIAEAGVPGYESSMWWGVSGPARMPLGVVTRLNSEIGAILRDPDTVKWLTTQAAEPMIASPEAFRRRIADDIAKWGKVAKAAGMKAD